jgi:hypothetical protein
VNRFRQWWATPRSSLITHRTVKWMAIFSWGVAEVTGWINSVAFISRISMAFGIYAVWSAEETAQVAVKQDEPPT